MGEEITNRINQMERSEEFQRRWFNLVSRQKKEHEVGD